MKIHFIAIGGSAMHNLALALHLKGDHITGSDDEIFNPSKNRLDARGILPEAFGWFPEKITNNLDHCLTFHIIIDIHHGDRSKLHGFRDSWKTLKYTKQEITKD